MNYIANIPFEDAPRELVEQLNSCDYTYNDYLHACPLFNALPTYWNFAVVNDDEDIIAFVWGTFEPLERFAHIVRISILPSARNETDETLYFVGDTIKEACEKMGVAHAFFITDHPNIFMNKVEGDKRLRFSEGKVLEVRLHENLH